jgi:hypothetical protein
MCPQTGRTGARARPGSSAQSSTLLCPNAVISSDFSPGDVLFSFPFDLTHEISMKIILLALSLLFAGAVTAPFHVSDAFAQQGATRNKEGAQQAALQAGRRAKAV